MAKRRSSIQRIDRLGTNALHRRDKKRKQVHPAGRLRKNFLLEKTRRKKKPNTNKHKTPEPGGLGEHKLHSQNGWEKNTHPHGIHHGGNKKHHRGREANKPPFPANSRRQACDQNRRTQESLSPLHLLSKKLKNVT
jgi:hypothetical protein